ncbi:hypothetical protein KV112_21885 [Mycolicibacter sp. MYC123]|uniref:DUF732 domain-containing protein n=1 Tax=[Mycobacterium] zoologicum TaxID=2872311 RepID=A0ABU5YQJ5_9MYCO|nr:MULTISPECIES: hypothetical protein [unclassified Mycolicibacter]MEB3052347.1 hypothetical protein [Mycolicibacter sp. MYC123]MEB3062226.1 hypothetical protein [Mycolicibacter sp. MYC101]
MSVRSNAAAAAVFAVAALTAGCGQGGGGESGLSCTTFSSVNKNPEQYVANTNAVSALLVAHGVTPSAGHHYNAAAGDHIMNVTVATQEVTAYCKANPSSTIDKGITWSNFKSH